LLELAALLICAQDPETIIDMGFQCKRDLQKYP
jgi:hypothetical protein